MFNLKKYKKQIIISLSILVVLIFAFWYGGDAPSLRGFSVDEDKTPVAAPVATESTTVTTGDTVDSSYTEEDYLVPTTTKIASTSQDQPEATEVPVLNEAESMQDNDTKKNHKLRKHQNLKSFKVRMSYQNPKTGLLYHKHLL